MLPTTGRALWLLLHSYAHALPDGPLSPDQTAHARAWLSSFDEAVRLASAGSCPCHQHWSAIRTAHPPDLATRQSFYWWTVHIHDQVNLRLGKPPIFNSQFSVFNFQSPSNAPQAT